jgi:hypothetical protein
MVEGVHPRYERFGVTSFTISADLVETLALLMARLAA